MGIKNFLGEIGTELIGEFFSINMLKGIITKAIAAKTATSGEKSGTKGSGESKSSEIPEAKFGGIFDLSDETAYLGLIAKMSTDPNMAGMAQKVSAFINGENFNPGQARRFRVVIGNLSNITYTKELHKEKKEMPRQQGRPIIEEKSSEVKTNLGIELIRSFAQLDENQMLEICKASGLMNSVFDNIYRGVESGAKAISQLAEKIESSESAQKVMITLADKMRARIAHLNSTRRN